MTELYLWWGEQQKEAGIEPLTDDDIKPLEHMTNLTMLILSSNQITDISPLAGLTNLTYLDLDSNPISDISPLFGLTDLRNLYLGYNQISDLSPLESLTNLEWLTLWNNPITLSQANALQEALPNCNIFHNACPICQDVCVHGGSPDFITIKGVEYSTSLDELHLSWLGLTDDDIKPLEHMTNLTGLVLHNNQISDLSPLSGLTNLETLWLDNNPINDLSPLSGLTNLKSLQSINNQISDISPLAGLTNLTGLSLRDNQISDLSPLSGLTNLERLFLSNNLIDGISPLSGLTGLQRLELHDNQISDISALSQLINLTNLSLGNNQISDISALSEMTKLHTLWLDNNQISDISPLSGCVSLYRLYAYNNLIGDVLPLAECTNLDFLGLSFNKLTRTNVNALRDLLPTNPQFITNACIICEDICEIHCIACKDEDCTKNHLWCTISLIYDCTVVAHNHVIEAEADIEIIGGDTTIGNVDVFAGSIVIVAEESGEMTIPASELDGIKTDNMWLFKIDGNRVTEGAKPVVDDDGSITVTLPTSGTYFLQRVQPGGVRSKGKVTGNASDITISDALHTLMAVAKMPSSDAYGDNADARSVRAAKVNDPDVSEIGISDALQVLMFVARMPSSKVTLLDV